VYSGFDKRASSAPAIYRHEDRMPDLALDVLRQVTLAGSVLDQDHLADTDCDGPGYLGSFRGSPAGSINVGLSGDFGVAGRTA